MLLSRYYYDLPLFIKKLKLNSVIQSEDKPIHMYQNYKLASSFLHDNGWWQSAIRISPIRTFF
jgi:hypothetical protein